MTKRRIDLLGFAGALNRLGKIEQAIDRPLAGLQSLLNPYVFFARVAEFANHLVKRVLKLPDVGTDGGGRRPDVEFAADDAFHSLAQYPKRANDAVHRHHA